MARKRRDTQKVPIIIVDPSGVPTSSRKRAPGGRTLAPRNAGIRRRGGGKKAIMRASGLAYDKVTGDLGVQIGCGISEMLAAGLATAAQAVAQATETSADDVAVYYGVPVVGNLIRFGASKIAKKHPGLAAVSSAAASAFNGVGWSAVYAKHGFRIEAKKL